MSRDLDKGPLTITFSSNENPIIEGLIDDKEPVKMLFDTGASQVCFSRKFRQTHDKRYGQNLTIRANVNSLSFGQFKAHGFGVDYLHQVEGDLDGVVGPSLFDGYVVTIDLKSHQLLVSDKPINGTGIVVPFQPYKNFYIHYVSGKMILFPATIDKNRVGMQFDTGAAVGSVNGAKFSRFKTGKVYKGSWGFGNIPFDYHLVNFKQMKLGQQLVLSRQWLEIIDNWDRGPVGEWNYLPMGQEKIDAILGMRNLKEFSRVTIDYPHNLLRFER